MLKRKKSIEKRNEVLWSVIFHSPGFIFFSIFLLIPILFVIYLSFFKWNITQPMRFVGISNYIKFFSKDPKVGKVTLNSFVFLLETVPAAIIIPLILSILLDKIRIGKGFFHTIYFLPLVSSAVAIALVWRWVFSTEYGVLNYILGFVLKEKISWLQDQRFALFSISLILVWKTIPINTILFLSAVKNVPPQLYESAKLDGCKEWKLFRYITVPMVSPTIFFLVILTTITSFFNGFDLVKVLTQGGPLDSTNIFVYYSYQKAFSTLQFGYASTISVIFFLFILIITFIQFVLQKKWVHY